MKILITESQLKHIIEPTSDCIGINDKNGNEICKGYIIKHNDNEFLIKWSKSQRQWVARAKSKSWRDTDWIRRLSKYIEIIGNIYEDDVLFNEWEKYL